MKDTTRESILSIKRETDREKEEREQMIQYLEITRDHAITLENDAAKERDEIREKKSDWVKETKDPEIIKAERKYINLVRLRKNIFFALYEVQRHHSVPEVHKRYFDQLMDASFDNDGKETDDWKPWEDREEPNKNVVTKET